MWIDGLLGLMAVATGVPAATFSLQVLMSQALPRTPDAADATTPAEGVADTPRGPVVVLIPAHNEAAGIGRTLAGVMPQLGPHDSVLVVADNCSDDTAHQARLAGALVTERSHASLRGKGYALDHGVRWLEQQAAVPALVLFLDADCRLTPGSLERLAQEVERRGTAVQALDLMHAPPGAPLQTRVAELAWLVKNQVRPMGMRRMGLPCQLMGTGMAIPWDVVKGAPLASGALAEDVELGLTLAEAGRAPVFCPYAAVHSLFPSAAASTQAQRKRWEHGHLSMIATRGLPLLGRGLLRLNKPLLVLALDICVPPLASLVMALVALTVLTASAWLLLGVSPWPLALALVSLAGVAASVLWAWHRDARHVVRGSELSSIPAYVLRKLPLYLDALRGRTATWQRARRDDD
jgi:cellulose synthase/poly-beta-1,6-N-acetylglucosamine synthase-like glycosyltransferase